MTDSTFNENNDIFDSNVSDKIFDIEISNVNDKKKFEFMTDSTFNGNKDIFDTFD